MTTQTAIYLDSDICRWHFDRVDLTCDRFCDVTKFINATNQRKIAMFHIPYPYEESGEGEKFERRIDAVLDCCERIIILASELHNITVDFVARYQHEKIEYMICGAFRDLPYHVWMDWFITTTHFYKYNPVKPLDRLHPYSPKPKYFDCLLGMPKPHRNILCNYIVENQFTDRILLTYLGHPRRIIEGENTDGWSWEADGLEIIDKDLKWTVSQVMYYGQQMSLSQVVPIDVYNHTAYSIVAETNFQNHYSFYTEKLVKPILGRRLFLAFGGQYYLKNLRNLGFKTFDGIIDESYDQVEDFEERGRLICEQIKYLLEQDQQMILDQVRPITEHNFKLLMQTDWFVEYCHTLRRLTGF